MMTAESALFEGLQTVHRFPKKQSFSSFAQMRITKRNLQLLTPQAMVIRQFFHDSDHPKCDGKGESIKVNVILHFVPGFRGLLPGRRGEPREPAPSHFMHFISLFLVTRISPFRNIFHFGFTVPNSTFKTGVICGRKVSDIAYYSCTSVLAWSKAHPVSPFTSSESVFFDVCLLLASFSIVLDPFCFRLMLMGPTQHGKLGQQSIPGIQTKVLHRKLQKVLDEIASEF